MKLLVLGSGGREHALCWKLSASPLCDAIWCAPGNAGIANVADCVAIDPADADAVIAFAREKNIDFVVVGPEGPLVAGIVDALMAAGIKAFGPQANAAILEGSKGFMKDLCARHNIPTALYGRFSDASAAKDFIRRHGVPIVVKADGLAAGKGVVIAETLADAERAVEDMLGGAFGTAGAEVVIEEFLNGEEVSFFALCDGKTAMAFGSAQDHKRVGDGDIGPNTGGMGAYSPAPIFTAAIQQEVMKTIINPTVAGLAAEGRPYQGVLFAGLMLTPQGPKLLEYNVRFGDPECQVLMLRLQSDLLPILIAAVDGQLVHVDARWLTDAALTVVMAARGYPGTPEKGGEIRGLEKLASLDNVEVFHAGTMQDGAILRANGGRVLNITAAAPTVAEAQRLAYAAVDRIDWPGGFCRRDIGWRAVGKN